MVTKYNVDFYINACHPNCPRDIYEKTGEVLREEGLIGVKHVNHFGRVFDGYDKSCETFRRGLLDIFYSDDVEETIPEMLEKLKLVSSGDDRLAQDTIESAEGLLEIMAMVDPCSVILPWNVYRKFPICDSLEINTPAGRQPVHYHTQDNIHYGVIQLWKPRKETCWYDFDVLKYLLFDASLMSLDISIALEDANKKHGFFGKRRLKKDEAVLRRVGKLYLQLSKNPDSIKKIPNFVKKINYDCVREFITNFHS